MPPRSLSTMPGLANRTQLCLMHANNTTTGSSLGTAWPSPPAGQNSSESDSSSNKAMLLLEGQQHQKHLTFFAGIPMALQDAISGYTAASGMVDCLVTQRTLQSILGFGKSTVISQHTQKSKECFRKRTPKDCLLKLEKL